MDSEDVLLWRAFLNGLDLEVKAAHKALDEGRPINGALIEPWIPPEGLGALPIELLDRAQIVNDALGRLEVRATDGQILLKNEMNRVGELKAKARNSRRSHYSESAIPMYVDRSV